MFDLFLVILKIFKFTEAPGLWSLKANATRGPINGELVRENGPQQGLREIHILILAAALRSIGSFLRAPCSVLRAPGSGVRGPGSVLRGRDLGVSKNSPR